MPLILPDEPEENAMVGVNVSGPLTGSSCWPRVLLRDQKEIEIVVFDKLPGAFVSKFFRKDERRAAQLHQRDIVENKLITVGREDADVHAGLDAPLLQLLDNFFYIRANGRI